MENRAKKKVQMNLENCRYFCLSHFLSTRVYCFAIADITCRVLNLKLNRAFDLEIKNSLLTKNVSVFLACLFV